LILICYESGLNFYDAEILLYGYSRQPDCSLRQLSCLANERAPHYRTLLI